MKYFEYISFFVILSTVLGASYFFFLRLRFDQYFRLVQKAFILKQKDLTGEKFFSTPGLKKIVKILLRKHQKNALEKLLSADIRPAVKCLKRYPLLGIILHAYDDPAAASRRLEKYVRIKPRDYEALSYLAALYLVLGKREKCAAVLNNLPDCKNSRYTRALKLYCNSWLALRAGEMLEASADCSRSIRLFEQGHAYYEAAKAQLLMGTIYRISAVEDVADFMFSAAAKMFSGLRAEDGIADAKGNLGMLMVMQNRFSDASAYFEEALAINQKIRRPRGSAEILNQIALLRLLEGKAAEAVALANEAIALHKDMGNPVGEAYGLDILSYTALERKDFSSLCKYAGQALILHREQKDLSAGLESMYLMATGCFEQNDFDGAEKILRQITETAKGAAVCFHIANAYNMLGLIFLHKGEFLRAKGLFYEALGYEEKNDRYNAAAVDFANIALIEEKCGHHEQARKNLQAAVEYAGVFEETELYALLKEKLEKY